MGHHKLGSNPSSMVTSAEVSSTSREEKRIEDKEDLALAHRYRLSLPSKPTQSSFRVLALLFYETTEDKNSAQEGSRPLPTLAPWVAQTTPDGRTFIVGANDEPGYLGGAICAERAAMVQLRFLPNFRITKVVIATDSIDAISPGMLCREFLAGHTSVPWDVPVFSSGCACSKCGLKDEELFSCLQRDQKTSICQVTGHEHIIPTLETTIRHLYPYPSPYTRLTAAQSLRLGTEFAARNNGSQNMKSLDGKHSAKLLELAMAEAQSHLSELHPIQFGAAAILDDGKIVTVNQSCALEYGCTLDAVSQLVPHFRKGSRPLEIVQADQFGIAHAPFAPARAFLTENGFDECRILVHDPPTIESDDGLYDVSQLNLKEVYVSDLAPHAPRWTEGTDRED